MDQALYVCLPLKPFASEVFHIGMLTYSTIHDTKRESKYKNWKTPLIIVKSNPSNYFKLKISSIIFCTTIWLTTIVSNINFINIYNCSVNQFYTNFSFIISLIFIYILYWCILITISHIYLHSFFRYRTALLINGYYVKLIESMAKEGNKNMDSPRIAQLKVYYCGGNRVPHREEIIYKNCITSHEGEI